MHCFPVLGTRRAAVKRAYIHFVTPKGKIIPLDTYNLFYRNGLDVKLREQALVAT